MESCGGFSLCEPLFPERRTYTPRSQRCQGWWRGSLAVHLPVGNLRPRDLHVRRAFITVGFLLFWVLPTEAQSIQSPSLLDALDETTPSGPSATTPTKNQSSAGSLFRALGHDFASLPSRRNFVTLGIGGALALAVHPAEHDLTAFAIRSDPLEDLFELGSTAGGGWAQIGGALGTYALGRGTGHQQIQILGADLLRAQIVNAALTQGIKIAVQRTRPDQGRFSFPSGHASATFATAMVLQHHFGWRVSVPAYGLATYVAGARVQENRHYASDVIFGAALGVVAGRTVKVGRSTGGFIVSPMAVPRGAGIAFERAP